MRLSIAQAVGLVSDTAWAGRPQPAGFAPVIGPSLRTAFVPSIHRHRPSPWEEPEEEGLWRRKGSGLGPFRPEAAGVLKGADSDRVGIPPKRYGFNGLTQRGAKFIRDACSLLEENRHLCGMWTVSIPDEAWLRMLDLDTWPDFQNGIRRRLAKALRERGLKGLLVGVVELHPERSERIGQAIPHIHVVYRGKRHRWAPWALDPADFDRIVWWAFWDACCWNVESFQGGQVEPVRKSVRRYLGKYATKSTRQTLTTQPAMGLGNPELCPRRWWFASQSMRALVVGSTVRLPSEFLRWAIGRRQPNQPGQLFHVIDVVLPDPRAPSVTLVEFRSAWALWLTWEAFERACILGEKPRPPGSSHGRPHPRQHPKPHQLL